MVNLGSMIRTALSDSCSRVVLVNPWDLRNDYLWGNSSHKLKHGTETPRQEFQCPHRSAHHPNPRGWQLLLCPRGTSTNGPKDCAASLYGKETEPMKGREVHMDHRRQNTLPTGLIRFCLPCTTCFPECVGYIQLAPCNVLTLTCNSREEAHS